MCGVDVVEMRYVWGGCNWNGKQAHVRDFVCVCLRESERERERVCV